MRYPWSGLWWGWCACFFPLEARWTKYFLACWHYPRVSRATLSLLQGPEPTWFPVQFDSNVSMDHINSSTRWIYVMEHMDDYGFIYGIILGLSDLAFMWDQRLRGVVVAYCSPSLTSACSSSSSGFKTPRSWQQKWSRTWWPGTWPQGGHIDHVITMVSGKNLQTKTMVFPIRYEGFMGFLQMFAKSHPKEHNSTANMWVYQAATALRAHLHLPEPFLQRKAREKVRLTLIEIN